MARRGVRLTVLCEDDEHKRFAHFVFLRSGYHYREIRVLPSPPGRGSAEQWVRTRYPGEVRTHRRSVSSQNVGLVVFIDADKRTVDDRHRQLAKQLRDEGVEDRSSHERIVIWIPMRHIETWVAYLLGHDVNETGDFKNLVRDEDYRPPTARFVEHYQDRDDRPQSLLPSLSKAFDEFDRLQD